VRDSKHKIYVVFSSFWGLCPQTLTGAGAPPLDSAGGGGLQSPRPLSFAPQPLTPGDATVLFQIAKLQPLNEEMSQLQKTVTDNVGSWTDASCSMFILRVLPPGLLLSIF